MVDFNHFTYIEMYAAQPTDANEEAIRPFKVTSSGLPLVEQLYTARGAQGFGISENLQQSYNLEIEGDQTDKSLF